MTMIEQAAKGTHDSVKQIIQNLNLPGDRLRALDAPCGHGGITQALSLSGFNIEALDIEPPQHGIDNASILKHDLNETLTYDDNEFDVCVSVEGIEHLDRPADFFHELVRVLKPGGHLIISTPNPDSLTSRYRMFTKGYATHFNPISATERTSGHIHPIDRLFIERLRLHANLEIEKISTNNLYAKKFPWNMLSGVMTRKLPEIYQDENVLYGDVLIYHFTKKKP